jgi:Rps23 Pro-64 3,4-dihydroxylase Tpa1-like proline 4-hydroxylase
MKKKVINKSTKDLSLLAKINKEKYQNSKPYPHIIIKNFFDKDFLNLVLEEFPDLSKKQSSINYENKNEIKFANNDRKHFKKSTKKLFEYLNSTQFLNFLQKISSIKERILPDRSLSGGGLHEIKRGGVLKVHTDFNKHPTKNLDRRINVLIYLNKKWKKNYGGELELWNKDMKKCVKKILPTFNTMVIFSTNDFTNHGHPRYLNCPKNISRKSVATYYFSKGRPNNEIATVYKKNRTQFKNRAGIENDVLIKNEFFKNKLRNTGLYQKIKIFEKKYIRTGKSKIKRKNS